MKLTARNVHRDVAYFYLGLIISFSISGIALNHRRTWQPSQYIYKEEALQVNVPKDKEAINKEWIAENTKKWQIQSEMRGFRIEDNTLKITYADDRVEVNVKTGKGKREAYRKRPLLGEMVTLHKDTNNAWIWYSDIFGLAMLTIAITGAFISKGKFSFAARGWKLTLVGVIFPLIFLFLLT